MLKFKKTDPKAPTPTRAHPTDAGLDLTMVSGEIIHKDDGNQYGVMIDTGIALELEPGYVAYVMPRSSMNKKGWHTCFGVIDADYRGSIKVILYNLTPTPKEIKQGDKIAQLVIHKVELPELEEITELSETERGSKGFGSTDHVKEQGTQ